MISYQDEPAVGVQTLILEHIAVAFTRGQGLVWCCRRLEDLLRSTGQRRDVIAAGETQLS
jgi:hypothetical protein